MKKKNLKNFIGQIFILKRGVELIDLLQDDYVTLYVNTPLMLLDIVPISTLLSSMNEDGYCSWDIRKKNEDKKLKHLASFLHGQQILYYDLDYQKSIQNFYHNFRLASGNKTTKTVKSQKQVKRKPKKWPPLRAKKIVSCRATPIKKSPYPLTAPLYKATKNKVTKKKMMNLAVKINKKRKTTVKK